MKDILHPKNPRRGQTLVEALVALSLLTAGFVGIAALLTRSFELNRTTSNDTQATYLAAEGIEITKSLIDHDVYENLAGNTTYSWGSCFDMSNGQVRNYEFEYDTISCPAGSVDQLSDPLYFDPNNHVYTYSKFGTRKTNFIRDIKVTDLGEDIDVQSIVTWTDAGESNTITVEDQFYNWHPAS
jgi:Tfp pilus assembly protein PilV